MLKPFFSSNLIRYTVLKTNTYVTPKPKGERVFELQISNYI